VTWTPYYNAQLVKPLIRQLAAIIYRDQADALASVGLAEAQHRFQEFQIALAPIRQWPSVLIAPASDAFDSSSDLTRKQMVALFIAAGVTHSDPNLLAELAEDYALALDRILNSIELSDFYTSLPLPPLSGFPAPPPSVQMDKSVTNVTRLFVASIDYGELRRARSSLLAMLVTLAVTVEMEEGNPLVATK
jgi:hypothetical protein